MFALSQELEDAFTQAISLSPGEALSISAESLAHSRKLQRAWHRYRLRTASTLNAQGISSDRSDPWRGLVSEAKLQELVIRRPYLPVITLTRADGTRVNLSHAAGASREGG